MLCCDANTTGAKKNQKRHKRHSNLRNKHKEMQASTYMDVNICFPSLYRLSAVHVSVVTTFCFVFLFFSKEKRSHHASC